MFTFARLGQTTQFRPGLGEMDLGYSHRKFISLTHNGDRLTRAKGAVPFAIQILDDKDKNAGTMKPTPESRTALHFLMDKKARSKAATALRRFRP
ncbi:hypothetical protein KM043_008933 [Ampulex compressa]|nr:hypothetical protein KM043_008933 [Ampulex compressa]